MTPTRIECSACGSTIDSSTDTPAVRTPCPACGAITRTTGVSLHEVACARDGIGVKAKRPGDKRPHFESRDTPEYSAARQKLVRREQIIDRENDLYYERVTDFESGEVIHLKEEPLSEHVGYGYAKAKKPPYAT